MSDLVKTGIDMAAEARRRIDSICDLAPDRRTRNARLRELNTELDRSIGHLLRVVVDIDMLLIERGRG